MDERTVKKLQAKAKQAQFARDEFVRAALITPQGREYFAWAMGLGRPNDNPFAGNALLTSFRCGEANVSKQIELHVLRVAPKGYFQILEEQQKEAYDDNADTASAPDSASAYAADPDPAEPDTSGSAL